MRRTLNKLAGIVLLVGIVLGGLVILKQSNANKSEAATTPVVPVGASVVNIEESILYLEDQVRKNPSHTGHQLSLVQTYMQYALQTRQEPTYIPKAEKLLKDLRKSHPDLYEANALQASLFNTLHEFEQARDLASSLIEENDKVAYVYGILIDALVELGQYEEAVEACDKMISIKPGLASYARASYLRELHGDGDGALEAMVLAADAAMVGSEERAWALYQIGQLYLAENNLPAASSVFSGILEERPGYAFAIGGHGHIQLIEGNYEEATRLLTAAYELVPADEFLEGLVEVYEATNEDEKKYAALDQIALGYQEADEMGENVRMEYADFLADLEQDLKNALQLAKKEYERRPTHLHALETYAWALHKLGRSGEAQEYIDQAMRLGTGDAMVYFRAADIYLGSGNIKEARTFLQKAIDANLHIESPSTALQAQKMFQGLSAKI